jgi:hypothetical protein
MQHPTWQHPKIYDILETALGVGAKEASVVAESPSGAFTKICEFSEHGHAEIFATIVAWDRKVEDISMYLYG